MIGRERLKNIARSMQAQDPQEVCRGRFILKTQETVYGSGVAFLSESELKEVLDFLGQNGAASAGEPQEAKT